MTKPITNLDDLEMETHGDEGYRQSFGVICANIGAQKLGYNLTVLPPGNKSGFFHNHHLNEEMFLILSGEGTLRFGDSKYPLKEHDIIACPPGGRDVAHQIINTGDIDLKYLALSTKLGADIVEFPDSNKVSATVGDYGDVKFAKVFQIDDAV